MLTRIFTSPLGVLSWVIIMLGVLLALIGLLIAAVRAGIHRPAWQGPSWASLVSGFIAFGVGLVMLILTIVL